MPNLCLCPTSCKYDFLLQIQIHVCDFMGLHRGVVDTWLEIWGG